MIQPIVDPPASRRADTRARLLQAATELFAQRGYHRTQVMDIVGIARVSAGTFYRHFEDKRAIFVAIADRVLEHEVAEARAAGWVLTAQTDEEAWAGTMVAHYEGYFERVRELQSLYRALSSSGRVDVDLDHDWRMRERATQELAAMLQAALPGQALDPRNLARMVLGATAELRHALIHGEGPSPDRAARDLTRFLWGALHPA